MIFSFFADDCPCAGKTHTWNKQGGFPVYGKLERHQQSISLAPFLQLLYFIGRSSSMIKSFTATIPNAKEEIV